MKKPSLLRSASYGDERRPRAAILAAGVVSVAAYSLLQLLSHERPVSHSREMLEAAETMQRATEATRTYCDSTGIEIDVEIDPNRTCLIGPELTPLMTTLGHLDAKRTTTDPTVASLIVHLLEETGVSAGDTIAVGSSASFPALLVATLAAAEAMDVHPVTIISLGASTYGATNPEFNLLDIYSLLLRDGVFRTPPAAVSLGGDEDVGRGFGPELKDHLLSQITAGGFRFISEADLRRNVVTRMEIYGGVAAFVNTGGSYANLGTSAFALKLQPGLNFDVALPGINERGVLFEMVARGIPVVHLLFIRGLTLRYGLDWDPIPLNGPGEVELFTDRTTSSSVSWVIGIPYILVISVLVAAQVRSSDRESPTSAEITL